MDYKKYQIIYAPDVLEKLKEIRDYISQNYSSTSGERKMEQIISDIEKLEVFPEVGFDADEKYGSKISHYHSTKGYTLSKNYIVLYHIEGEENRVVIDYLLPTQSDYIKLFK
ncbi:TPA: type II toxin-antitoxin system RelE/ParE family toxin [Streptococcus pyogenes]|nr:type II toxin-antitoxin system RelE/ParE family toxin [Streptococcus pyogenes]HEP2167369.1 type II toxin-antitoxin system RelE/ParE family toxin [Streptococcus pyogenes]